MYVSIFRSSPFGDDLNRSDLDVSEVGDDRQSLTGLIFSTFAIISTFDLI